jgi:hypothetical protein
MPSNDRPTIHAPEVLDAAEAAIAEMFPGAESLAEPRAFRNGLLVLVCTTPVIAEEIMAREQEFAQAVNDELGEDVVTRVRAQ